MGFTVVKIPKKVADAFVKAKHYSRKSSIFWAGFGLVEDGYVVGVVVYGQPSPALQKHAFNARNFRFYELSRLVIQTKSRNAASYLISKSLDMLPKPAAIVSYADSEHNHCGIVYQATNWTYTGGTLSHDKAYLIDGERVHPMTLRDRGITNPTKWAKENSVEMVKPKVKHRYFFFVGKRKEKHEMRSKLAYKVVAEYPKCDQIRYDDGEILRVLSPVIFNPDPVVDLNESDKETQ